MLESNSSLTVLARRLLSPSPPAFGVLIARITESEDYGVFIDLVRDYLPENEREILDQTTPAGQITLFADYFEKRYFPLHFAFKTGEIEEYSELTRNIPVIARGISWNDYDEIPAEGRPAVKLLTFLLENPYEEGDARVALGEACAEQVTADILQRVPSQGFKIAELHKLVGGTKYSALELWGKDLAMSTGNLFLDVCDDDLYGGGYEMPEWSREEVEGFTREWKEADEIDDKVFKLFNWLEEDTPAHFKEVLDFLLERKAKVDGANIDQGTGRLPVGAPGEP